MHIERQHIQGFGTTTVGAGPFRVITIPLLPNACMWTVTGTITQAPVGLKNNAVTYNVQYGGRNAGIPSASSNDATNTITSNPSEPSGYAPGSPPALVNYGVSDEVNTSCLEI